MPPPRDFAPPIAVRAARKLIPRAGPADAREQGADFYDGNIPEKFTASPPDSPYCFLWTVIADRVARGGHRSVFDLGCSTGQLDRLLSDFGVEDLTRHFDSVHDVHQRYGAVLDGSHVRAFRAPRQPNRGFFLLEGIVKGG